LQAQSTNTLPKYNSPNTSPSLNNDNLNQPNSNLYPTNSSAWNQNSTNANQWNSQSSTSNPNQVTNPNQPYTQPSNLPTSYADSRENKFWAWTDDEIGQKIRWTIRDDKSLSTLAKSTEVSVKNNNVTLSGTVESKDEKTRIANIARDTQGVKSVSNNITVNSK
jgi:osmotically-inducible protein OsmY